MKPGIPEAGARASSQDRQKARLLRLCHGLVVGLDGIGIGLVELGVALDVAVDVGQAAEGSHGEKVDVSQLFASLPGLDLLALGIKT